MKLVPVLAAAALVATTAVASPPVAAQSVAPTSSGTTPNFVPPAARVHAVLRQSATPTKNPKHFPMRAWSIQGTTGSNPNSVVVDRFGTIYTADTGGNTVTKVTRQGYSSIFGATGDQPMGIALDDDGNVYTSNFGDSTVTKITSAGVVTTLGTTGKGAMGIKVNRAGVVYVANYLDSTVTKITPTGTSSVLGETGTHPLGIALDSMGNVYTANEGSDTVTRITPGGQSSVFGSTGGWPQAIAIDREDNVYTANWTTSNVSKISRSGRSVILGVTGERPIGITVDSKGNVFTTNNGDNSISIITPKGSSHIVAVTEIRPSGITVDADDNLYAVNFVSNTVTKVAPTLARRVATVNLSTVTVGSPGNRPAWIIPFYNDVYTSKATCEQALPDVQAAAQANPDPSVQKVASTNCMAVGAVPVKYNIGEFEITTEQWVNFLNLVDPNGLNANHLWDEPEQSAIWPKYGSINRNLKAERGHKFYVASPGWANRPYGAADFNRAARFINSVQNGKVLTKRTTTSITVDGSPLRRTIYVVQMSTKTESGMYDMSNPRTKRTAVKGFAITSQDEWIKAAYFDPEGGGKFSYWDYPTNPGLFVNCPVDEEGCADGEQPNAAVMDANGNITNAADQPLASFVATPGTAPDWCPVLVLTAEECTTRSPFPAILPYNGNLTPVGQAKTRSPWGTLDQGGNVVEVLDTIAPPPELTDPKIVWRRWHGGVVTSTAYQMWLSAVGVTPQTIPGYAINPWRGFRISVTGL
jgi:sugar lactone lactonase YvrE